MLRLALAGLSLAALLGALLAVLHLRPGRTAPPPLAIRLAHGCLAGASYAALLAAIVLGPARGSAAGVGAFGWDAVGLLGFALLLGLAVPVLARARGKAAVGGVAGLHGLIAMMGYVIALAYASLG